MTKHIKTLLITFLALPLLFFTSCTGDAQIKLNKDDSVSFSFEGRLGEAFKEMMSGSGSDLSNVDLEGIENALSESGFENINVKIDNEKDLISISFDDVNKDSYLFDEGIIKVNNDNVLFSLTPLQFVALYNSCGEDIQILLDLFMSPVLNEEEMSEEEYLDTIYVTYGDDTGNELKESSVNFTIIDKNKKSRSKSLFAASIFCGVSVSL